MRLLILLNFIFLSSCAQVTIADDPWCADAGIYGARCTTTNSHQHFSLNKYQWDKLRAGQICTATKQPGLGYKNVKVPIEKLCTDSNLCTPGQKADLSAITKDVDGLLDSTSGSPSFGH
jgi:hypothetical protein